MPKVRKLSLAHFRFLEESRAHRKGGHIRYQSPRENRKAILAGLTPQQKAAVLEEAEENRRMDLMFPIEMTCPDGYNDAET